MSSQTPINFICVINLALNRMLWHLMGGKLRTENNYKTRKLFTRNLGRGLPSPDMKRIKLNELSVKYNEEIRFPQVIITNKQ